VLLRKNLIAATKSPKLVDARTQIEMFNLPGSVDAIYVLISSRCFFPLAWYFYNILDKEKYLPAKSTKHPVGDLAGSEIWERCFRKRTMEFIMPNR
jgi:hypothetical protein